MKTRPDAEARAEHPGWAVKPLRQLSVGELAEALEYVERIRPDDDVLGRAIAGEFARRTAAEYQRTGARREAAAGVDAASSSRTDV